MEKKKEDQESNYHKEYNDFSNWKYLIDEKRESEEVGTVIGSYEEERSEKLIDILEIPLLLFNINNNLKRIADSLENKK